jgi:hypothetical protein
MIIAELEKEIEEFEKDENGRYVLLPEKKRLVCHSYVRNADINGFILERETLHAVLIVIQDLELEITLNRNEIFMNVKDKHDKEKSKVRVWVGEEGEK